jgi:peptidoglycan/xylan/chitin deacetylase (PgdA/CDA1 family)
MRSATILICLFVIIVAAQSYTTGNTRENPGFRWPEGKKMALSLTFDDARPSEVTNGIPLLDRYGVKATFYVVPSNVLKKLDVWKKAVKNGHEIGNHTVRHPCTGNHHWARRKALEDYTLYDMIMELDSANRFIEKNLGVRPRSYAYTCGETFVGRGKNTRSYVPVVAEMFENGRGGANVVPNDPSFCDMYQLTSLGSDGKSFEEILPLIESAKDKGQWLILVGHEMAEAERRQTTLLSTVEEICKYATDPANGIWIDNVSDIADYIREQRGEL